jgi:hypothetical protein
VFKLAGMMVVDDGDGAHRLPVWDSHSCSTRLSRIMSRIASDRVAYPLRRMSASNFFIS